MTSRASVVILAVLACAAGAHAQQPAAPSLAEVARQAEAAKPRVRKATRTFTNASLSADPRGGSEPVPAAAPAEKSGSKSMGAAPPVEEVVARGEAKGDEETGAKESEETWRRRATSLRQQIDKLRERLEQLSTPNALTEESPLLKAANTADIANARTALDGLRKQWGRLEASAREQKIPLAWIEPLAQF